MEVFLLSQDVQLHPAREKNIVFLSTLANVSISFVRWIPSQWKSGGKQLKVVLPQPHKVHGMNTYTYHPDETQLKRDSYSSSDSSQLPLPQKDREEVSCTTRYNPFFVYLCDKPLYQRIMQPFYSNFGWLL